MRGVLPGRCPACAADIAAGQEIEMLLGAWVHQPCKRAEIARRTAAAGAAVEIPAAERQGGAQAVGVRAANRRSLKSLKDRRGRR